MKNTSTTTITIENIIEKLQEENAFLEQQIAKLSAKLNMFVKTTKSKNYEYITDFKKTQIETTEKYQYKRRNQ